MSLRCSLLGHSYGEAEIEREREEQGSEVVVTVREFEACERCGKQNVLSENKEVTAIDSPAPDLERAESAADEESAPADATTTDAATADPGPDAGPETATVGDDAEIMTDSADDGASAGAAGTPASAAAAESGDAAGATADAGSPEGSEEGQSAADDDGVILDDESEDAEGRQPGEWPEAETTHPAEADETDHAEWPEVGREDEGFDAEPGGGSADVEFGGGLTPESAPEVDESETDEVEFVNADGDRLRAPDEGRSEPELSTGISAGAEAPTLSGPADDPDVDAEFVCPECDYREAVAGSSLRAGDICPECARGYLAQE